ncbi:MAG: hypothetical protein R3264_09305 [Anaerolineae bacterium]|nr:hypothetical protein [Anaerolineae bacterium]
MPVSKKRKKKRSKPAGPPPKGGFTPKPKITRQRIILYVISAVMVITLVASLILGSGGQQHTGTTQSDQTIETSDGNNLLTDPSPVDASSEEAIDQESGAEAVEEDSESTTE